MDPELLICATDEPLSSLPLDSLPVVTPLSNVSVARSSLEQFTGAVGAALAPHDIGLRLDEAPDGSRVLTAWRFGISDHWHLIPADTVRIGPDEVEQVAAAIRRTLDRALTD